MPKKKIFHKTLVKKSSDQVALSQECKVGLSVQKPNHTILPLNRINEKIKEIISIDAKKSILKYSTLIKTTLSKLGIKRKFLSPMKGISEKPSGNKYLKVKYFSPHMRSQAGSALAISVQRVPHRTAVQ